MTPELVAEVSRIVTFGCIDHSPQGTQEKPEGWSIPGATEKPMEELRGPREELTRRIGRLIASLPTIRLDRTRS